ncbi:MAG: hypothetical protein H7145_04160 [Akkermansiaceae bacterium]|nr:hypothetical protein [Armatimonadota bacterium]
MNNTTIAAIETALMNSFKMHGNHTCNATETGDLFIAQHKRTRNAPTP